MDVDAAERANLSRFINAYLQRVGAVTEPCGYAALEVLLPDDLAEWLGGNDKLMVFDAEVAEETPGSIFVTHGSQVLDKVVESVLGHYGRLTAFYRPGPPPELPANFEQRVLSQLDFRRCRAPKVGLRVVEENIYYGFYFRSLFRSYEQSEELLPIVVNAATGRSLPEFLAYWQRQVPAAEREYSLPKGRQRPIKELFAQACREADKVARDRSAEIMAQGATLKKKEESKLTRYYGEMETQVRRKLEGSEDPDKKTRLEQQLAAILADRERREKDLNERYGVEVDIRLDHVAVYYVPCLRVRLELQHKDKLLPYTVLFNPVIGEIEPPVCECCGNYVTRLVPSNGRFVCDNCL